MWILGTTFEKTTKICKFKRNRCTFRFSFLCFVLWLSIYVVLIKYFNSSWLLMTRRSVTVTLLIRFINTIFLRNKKICFRLEKLINFSHDNESNLGKKKVIATLVP
jgi:hypothetical protein